MLPHTIKCKVTIVLPGMTVGTVFTRRKARFWAMKMGPEHILNAKECGHPECMKARAFMARGILGQLPTGMWYYTAVGVNPASEYALKKTW